MLLSCYMTIKTQSNHTSLYFFAVLAVGCICTFLGDEEIRNYGPAFYMMFGFPVHFLLFQLQFRQFSKQLKDESPDLFRKYVLSYTVQKGQVIRTDSLFYNEDFRTLESPKLGQKYKLVLKCFWLSIASFLLIIPIMVGLIMTF